MPTWMILVNGFLKVGIWGVGACFATYKKRALLAVGCTIAVVVSAVRAIDDAAHPHGATVDTASLFATVAAGFLIGSFMAKQKRDGRPGQWGL